MSFSKSYLLLYNICQSLGWSLVLYHTVGALLATKAASDVYAAAGLTTREHLMCNTMHVMSWTCNTAHGQLEVR